MLLPIRILGIGGGSMVVLKAMKQEPEQQETRDPTGPERGDLDTVCPAWVRNDPERDELACDLIDHDLGRVVILLPGGHHLSGPKARDEHHERREDEQGEAAQNMQDPDQRQGRKRSPCAGGRAQISDAADGSDQTRDVHAFTRHAVASDAIPSLRPVKPRRSDVVALTET